MYNQNYRCTWNPWSRSAGLIWVLFCLCRVMAAHFWRFCPEWPHVCREVMVKCFEPIVVAHSGLADKQYVGTRRPPATLTDKTALIWWWLVCVCVLGRGEDSSASGTYQSTHWWNVTSRRSAKSRTTKTIRRHEQLCWEDHAGPACGAATAIPSLTSARS